MGKFIRRSTTNASGEVTPVSYTHLDVYKRQDPTIYLDAKGGVPQEERQALTDEQVERLLDTIRDLPPYVLSLIHIC